MFCDKCGVAVPDGATVCGACGEPITNIQPIAAIPEENRPLSPWTYWSLQLLVAVPVVGLAFLIVFSIKRDNINRCNFARSCWYWYIIIGTVVLVALLVMPIVDTSIFSPLYWI